MTAETILKCGPVESNSVTAKNYDENNHFVETAFIEWFIFHSTQSNSTETINFSKRAKTPQNWISFSNQRKKDRFHCLSLVCPRCCLWVCVCVCICVSPLASPHLQLHYVSCFVTNCLFHVVHVKPSCIRSSFQMFCDSFAFGFSFVEIFSVASTCVSHSFRLLLFSSALYSFGIRTYKSTNQKVP